MRVSSPRKLRKTSYFLQDAIEEEFEEEATSLIIGCSAIMNSYGCTCNDYNNALEEIKGAFTFQCVLDHVFNIIAWNV